MYYALRKLAFINRAVNAPVSEKCSYPRSASEAKCGLNKTGYTEPCESAENPLSCSTTGRMRPLLRLRSGSKVPLNQRFLNLFKT